jgi:hypothetical protein
MTVRATAKKKGQDTRGDKEAAMKNTKGGGGETGNFKCWWRKVCSKKDGRFGWMIIIDEEILTMKEKE